LFGLERLDQHLNILWA